MWISILMDCFIHTGAISPNSCILNRNTPTQCLSKMSTKTTCSNPTAPVREIPTVEPRFSLIYLLRWSSQPPKWPLRFRGPLRGAEASVSVVCLRRGKVHLLELLENIFYCSQKSSDCHQTILGKACCARWWCCLIPGIDTGDGNIIPLEKHKAAASDAFKFHWKHPQAFFSLPLSPFSFFFVLLSALQENREFCSVLEASLTNFHPFSLKWKIPLAALSR